MGIVTARAAHLQGRMDILLAEGRLVMTGHAQLRQFRYQEFFILR